MHCVLVDNFSFIKTNLNYILENYSINYHDIFNKKPLDLTTNYRNDWKTKIISELIECREGMKQSILSFKEISDMIYELCVC